MDFSQRDPVKGVDPQFIERWSPRAFEPGELAPGQLERLLDAARWAPSCFNEQPWRFYISTGETFDSYLSLLVEANQAWAKNASAIGFLMEYDRLGFVDAIEVLAQQVGVEVPREAGGRQRPPELLLGESARVRYHDPFVPQFNVAFIDGEEVKVFGLSFEYEF